MKCQGNGRFQDETKRIGKTTDNFRMKIFCRMDLHQTRKHGKGTDTWSVACLGRVGENGKGCKGF